MADRDKDEGALMNAVAQWVEKADYDIETARAMYKTKRYFYVPFCCQQAIEKMLKAIVVRKTAKLPPRIHNLVKLAQLCELDLGEDRERFFTDLVNLYAISRYPGEFAGNAIDAKKAKEIQQHAEEAMEWLRTTL